MSEEGKRKLLEALLGTDGQERFQLLPERVIRSLPQIIYNAVKLPGDVLNRRFDITPETPGVLTEEDMFRLNLANGEILNRASDLAGLVTLGGTRVSLPKHNNSLASRSANIYNPPVKPQRAFEADYPQGAISDEFGRLQRDIEGRPLSARYVVGRTQSGGGDVALPSQALDEIAQAGTGSPIGSLAQSELRGDLGRVSINPYTRQPLDVAVSNRLTATQYPKVSAHEVGHVIDQVAGEIPTKGLSKELGGIYNSLNNGMRNAAGDDVRASAKAFAPQHQGYKGDDIQRELMAEAIRSYMTDPNYIKTVAPKTAAQIRGFVNPNPNLNKIIQFNAIPATAAMGSIFGSSKEK